jgi:uncharacterized metal-binding protein
VEAKFNCAFCQVRACCSPAGEKKMPAFCPMQEHGDLLEDVRQEIASDESLRGLLAASARTEATDYPMASRMENTIDFAQQIGAKRLGIATCVGCLREARIAQEILESHGFEVWSVGCKAGSIPKEEVGLRDDEKIHPGQFEPICDPVSQARLLNQARTDLNVVVGLCVGHDSLFFKYSDALATVLIAKDRVSGHNPAAALYTSQSYYSRLWGDKS